MRERRLRPQQESSSEPLFEYDLSAPDADAPLVLVGRPARSAVLVARLQPEPQDPSKVSEPRAHPPASNIRGENVAGGQKNSDPMSPELFYGHHRRIEREERRMQHQEKQQLLVDYGRVLSQRTLLIDSDWREHIGRIVHINNNNDDAEVNAKRRLVIDEIDDFLRKYDQYKKRRTSSIPEEQRPSSASVTSVTKRKKARDPRVTGSKRHKGFEPVPQPPVSLNLRPVAFGFMMFPRVSPPREFALPANWVQEREAEFSTKKGHSLE